MNLIDHILPLTPEAKSRLEAGMRRVIDDHYGETTIRALADGIAERL